MAVSSRLAINNNQTSSADAVEALNKTKLSVFALSSVELVPRLAANLITIKEVFMNNKLPTIIIAQVLLLFTVHFYPGALVMLDHEFYMYGQ